MIKAVLFDLDGTLLPMEQEQFIEAYMGGLVKKLIPHGYDPKQLLKGVGAGIYAMVNNDGMTTNEEVFWKTFSAIVGEKVKEDEAIFFDFYQNEFQEVSKVCGYEQASKKVIDFLKEKGIRVILATNPLFPSVATASRIRWAGLSTTDFELYTTYENSSFCKPNPKYYEEILAKIGLKAEECIMVGNDVTEDMVTETMGMKVFLLTDCLINKENKDISKYPNGSFAELLEFLEVVLKIKWAVADRKE